MNKTPCKHEWEKLQRVTVFDNCTDSCPKEVPNDHGHAGRAGLLAICMKCEKKKVLGEDSNKINALNINFI